MRPLFSSEMFNIKVLMVDEFLSADLSSMGNTKIICMAPVWSPFTKFWVKTRSVWWMFNQRLVEICLFDLQIIYLFPNVKTNHFNLLHKLSCTFNFNSIQFHFLTQVLKTVRTAEFKPYVIFVKPQISESQKKHHGSSSSLGFMITVSYWNSSPLK